MKKTNEAAWVYKTVSILLAVLGTLAFITASSPAADIRTIRVGVYEDPPKVFTDTSGRPAGIFIDILKRIAEDRGWEISYRHGTWQQGLERLARGQIDLMPDVAYTARRDVTYSFNTVPVLSVWSQVYARKSSQIRTILDLKGKRVAVLEQSIQLQTLQTLAGGFDLHLTLIPVTDYETEFRMIAEGKVDAGVTNRFFGLMKAREFGLQSTPVIFDPAPYFFAAPKKGSREVLEAIDRELAAMKVDPQSAYYASLRRWTGEKVRFEIPVWLRMAGLVMGFSLLGSLAAAAVFKRKVRERTRELDRINENLREEERRYRMLFENNPVPMLIYQRVTFKMLAVNDAFVHHYGYSREQALSFVLTDLYPEEEKERIAKVAMGLKGRAYVGEWHHVRADGSVITIVARSHDISFWSTEARIAVLTDVTEMKRLEAELRESSERFAAIFEMLPLGVCITRPEDGVFLHVNSSFGGIVGYANAEMIGHTSRELDVWRRPEDRDAMIRGLSGTGEYRRELILRRKGGAHIPVNLCSKLIPLDGFKRLLVVIEDISERKKAEEAVRELTAGLERRVAERTAELAVAKERAEAADRLKSAFLATMSHELRTPLNSIIGFTGIILMGLAGPLNEEQSKQLRMVEKSANHLLSLINDVLDISKIEAGQLDVGCKLFDVRSSIDKVAGIARPMAEKKGLRLGVEIAPEIDMLASDSRRFEQVLLNLLNNAVKFTERGGVRLTAWLAPPSPGGSHPEIRVSIADTGIGIKPEDFGTLFQPFRQIDTGLSRQHEGTGLGLAICRKLAELLGGRIEVESKWGEGSVFTFSLPA
ncbi:MAG: PAS domain S-box protein [Syntrophobacteraceae bacterium]|nr:PAS domain S-box protein [Syntrophobacteraceae bacterium]